MSASTANKATGPRQVTCQTSENDQLPVELDLLLLSRTFKNMYGDLGLEEHDEFPGVFPVKAVNSRTFYKVIDWCKEHKVTCEFVLDDPEPVIEKDSLTQECKWFTFTESERRFFDVPTPELLELIMAADYLDVPGLRHYACQAVAACIKGKSPREICDVLQQDCDLDRARITAIRTDNPWLALVPAGARIENPIFIPNEVLVTIFEKLPREDLERLQLVSAQFDDLIVSSVKLSEHQGPLRVVSKLELVAYSQGRFSLEIDVCLRDGTVVTCSDYDNLAKRLKFSTVQKLRAWYGALREADIHDFSSLLPVRAAWKNATAEISTRCWYSTAHLELLFTQLAFCKEIILGWETQTFTWLHAWMRLPAIAACNKLDVGRLSLEIQPADVVEWLEHEVPPEEKWSEPRQLIVGDWSFTDGIDGLLTALKTAFSASSTPKPYVVRIIRHFHRGNLNELLANEKTHEVLRICAERGGSLSVNRE